MALPTSMQEWLLAQPESHLSAKLAQMANLNTLTTLLNAHVVHNPVNQPRRNLIVHQELVARQMSEEVELALIDLMGSDSEQFRVINVEYVVRRVISRAVNRVFVGPEICKCLPYLGRHSMRRYDNVDKSQAAIAISSRAASVMFRACQPLVF